MEAGRRAGRVRRGQGSLQHRRLHASDDERAAARGDDAAAVVGGGTGVEGEIAHCRSNTAFDSELNVMLSNFSVSTSRSFASRVQAFTSWRCALENSWRSVPRSHFALVRSVPPGTFIGLLLPSILKCHSPRGSRKVTA